MEPNELSELTIRNKLKTLKNQDRFVSVAASLVALKIELKNSASSVNQPNPEINRSFGQLHLEVVGKCSSIGWTNLTTSNIVHQHPANYNYIGETIQDEVTETVALNEVILFMTKLVAAIELMNGA